MFNERDVTFEMKVGQGPGGQHRNKTASCVVATHEPTGIQVTIDERKQHANKRKALKLLRRRVLEHYEGQRAEARKQRRDRVIHETERVRTYDFKSGTVKDHRTGKVASLKDILEKGKLWLLR